MAEDELDPPNKIQHVFLSAFMEGLQGRRLKLLEQRDRGEPLHAYAQAHRRLSRQLDTTITAITRMEDRRAEERWNESRTADPAYAADAFQDLVYRATELFDFYALDIPAYLSLRQIDGPVETHYRKGIKSRRDLWASLCNRCKHNHRFLVPVEGRLLTGVHVTGFSLCGRVENQIAVDRVFHRQAECTSYNAALRQLISDIFFIDTVAAGALSFLPNDPDQPQLNSLQYTLPYLNNIKKIVGRSTGLFPGEPCPPRISLDDGIVNIEEVKLPAEAGSCKLSLWIDILGNDLKFVPPYQSGPLTLSIQARSDLPRPLAPFVRIMVTDLDASWTAGAAED